MTKIQVAEYNHLTGENIVRDMTDDEIEQLEAENAATQQLKIEAEANKAALEAKKLEVLEKLGLTAEEAAALFA
jgi:hypothetical protein